MAGRFIDLSISIEDGLPSDPPAMIPKILYMEHEAGAQSMAEFFPGMEPSEDLPGGLGWAVEILTLSTHSGTHLDAPWHYHPTMDGGKPALTIEDVPLEWCMGPGVVLDFRHFPDGYRVMPADVEDTLKKMDYELKEGDIVLVMTGADKYWGKLEYLSKGCGMSRKATLWILEHGVKVTGTDAWSWDRPFSFIIQDYQETGDASLIWEGHFASIERGYCHIEKLTNLDQLPPHGFTLFCFPVKIKGASAGWIRAVAMV
ncbi:MAG: cyclase family protein [Actinomycetota bacterium]|nr:cyclase family protein [Actinomycetota bacterium]